MTLTMPTSNRAPGRAARLTPVEGGGEAAAVAGLGEVARQVGRRIEGDVLRRQSQKARVDFTRELGELRLSVDEIGDPDQKGAAWDQGTTQIRDRYFGEESALDPRVRRDLENPYQELADRHSLQIGRQTLQLRQAESEALWIDYSHDVANQASTLDGEGKDELLAQAFDQLDELVAAGVIDAAEAAKRRLGLVGEVDNAAALRVLASDPEAFLQMQKEGAFDGIGPELNARYSNQANTSIAKRAEDAQKESERLAKERDKEIGTRLTAMADIYGKDRLPFDEAFLDRPDVKAHPDYPRVMAAKHLRAQKIDLQSMTPTQIAAAIEDERGRSVQFKYQTEYLDMLEDELEKAEKAWSTDPIQAARDRLGESIPDLDLAGRPGHLASQVFERVKLVEDLHQSGHTDLRAYFSEDELDQIKDAIGPEADAAERARLAAEFGNGFKRVPDGLAAISDDPIFRHVSTILADGASARTAREIFQGQQAIENNTSLLPPQGDRTGEAFENLGGLFAHLPKGEGLQGQVMDAADALYARRKRLTDPTDDIDAKLYRQVFHEVMGGTGEQGGSTARGGVHEIRGQLTLLPAGVAGEKVDGALSKLGLKRVGRSTNEGYREPDADLLASHLAAISQNGLPPTLGSTPVDRETVDQLTIRSVADDVFVFVFPTSNGGLVLTDAEGEEYRFSMRGLLRAVKP